ncbi:hypothetical protein BBBOND_0109500 [Babesia bigemina]|uniref:Uncharacterized protein n=1 Tax=Babesia bigemina TaxID=5866 RepID=A0A061D3J9_BABBI|nr:hypothetical protein BBBOND_0109500 [Babesia bigemina]CDR94652.1 hypothetical protein BBBOND_0109500 [Babesia bigemina]|eukprot:XP_012766838.1 hypothetical protein BBBOND_0109500 [Babesia bigemina]
MVKQNCQCRTNGNKCQGDGCEECKYWYCLCDCCGRRLGICIGVAFAGAIGFFGLFILVLYICSKVYKMSFGTVIDQIDYALTGYKPATSKCDLQ